MSEPQSDTVLQRLECLEQEVRQCKRESRWWRCATMLSLIVMGALFLMGQAPPKPRVIEAERFVVKDANGKVRGILGAKPPNLSPTALMYPDFYEQYGLHLYAAEGRYIAGLSGEMGAGDHAAARLELHDKKTASSVLLMIEDSHALLRLQATEQTHEAAERASKEEIKRFNAAKTFEERYQLSSARSPHNVYARLSVSPKDNSFLELVHEYSGMWFNLLNGQPAFKLTDEKGARAVLGYTTLERTATGVVEQRPASSLVLFDKEGKVLWKVPQ